MGISTNVELPIERLSARDLLASHSGSLLDAPLSELPPDMRERLALDLSVSPGRTVGGSIRQLLSGLTEVERREDGKRIERLLVQTVLDLRTLCGSIQGVRDLQVVDIACGARATGSGQFGVRYEPWRARLLSQLGAQVIGIDTRRSDGEPYLHQVANLKTDLLSGVMSRSCDLAIWSGYYWVSPEQQWFGGAAEQQHVDALRQDVRRVLRPGGILYDGKSIVERIPV